MTSDLAAFASEEPLSTTDGAIPLTQLALRKTSVSWMEALACIQQICDAAIASGKGPLNESSIYLHDSGTFSIEASGETTPEETVRFVGDLLGAWLEGTPHPMALDTILLAAADSPPSYASVAEFAAALKPYERPERAQRVQAVYHRAGGPVSTQRTSTSEPPIENLELRTENRELRTEHREPSTENLEPPSPFRRSHFRTPYIVPDAAPTSMLLNHQLHAGDEQPVVPVPARRSVQDVIGDIRRRVVAGFEALAERLRPLLQALLVRLRALPNRLRPLAKPLAVVAIAAVALGALGLSGWMLVTTLLRPSQPTTAPATTARVEAPTANVAVAAPAPAATPAAKIAVPQPVATSTDAAASKAPAATTPTPARVAATPTATPPASAKPEPSIAERATATVDRAIAAILPPPSPRRSTSIVLEPDRASQGTTRSSARTASARSAPTVPSSAPAATSPSGPPESAPAIELQAAAPPVPETTRSAEAVAAPAAVVAKYPEPPPPATIYSSDDAGVVPPVQTYPRYVESLGPDHPGASPFQVVIDENGLVESAALARYPTNMRQAVSGTLLLAAAKAWRFQPATKDGYPVKYRRIIWFSNQ